MFYYYFFDYDGNLIDCFQSKIMLHYKFSYEYLAQKYFNLKSIRCYHNRNLLYIYDSGSLISYLNATKNKNNTASTYL